MTVLVTGSEGRVGRAVVSELRGHGYRVTPADRSPQHADDTKVVGMQDLGQVLGVMQGENAVVHMAAIPSPGNYPPEVIFRNNVMSTFNIREAATLLGVQKVVLASSISCLSAPRI